MKRGLSVLILTSVLTLACLAADVKIAVDEVVNEQMVSLYEQGTIGQSVWVIDSRSASRFMAGHLPGAVNLPLETLMNDPLSVQKLSLPKSANVVLYCAGPESTLSLEAAAIFRKLGYTNVRVFRNGVTGWNQKAQPLLATEAFLRKGNLILLDLEEGQLTLVSAKNQTVQLSLQDLDSAKAQAVLGRLSRNAPVVVLARASMVNVVTAMDLLREQDFRRVTYFPIAQWPGVLAAASLTSELSWTPVYASGQVSPSAFQSAVASGEFILDARSKANFDRGHFKDAINVPIEDLAHDFAQVPKDVAVYVYCTSGAKSIKAYDVLGHKGYANVFYLDAEVTCKGEVCTIKE